MIIELYPRNAFTVDLEDWFQGLTSTNPRVADWPSFESRVVPATMSLLGLLDSHQVKATFFTLGYVADQWPSLIEEIARRGHEIGLHGYFHRFVNRLTPEGFAEEIDRGTEAIQRVTGTTPIGHRAPYFSIDARTPWALNLLAERGFRYDSSVFPSRNPLYGFPGARREPHRAGKSGRLIEFPVSTIPFKGYNLPFAGGFYMRTWPYPLVRWAMRRLHHEGLPAVFYVHPWELDLDQPRTRVTFRERITHYHGRRGLRGKLDRLFSDFRFGPLSTFLDTVRV